MRARVAGVVKGAVNAAKREILIDAVATYVEHGDIEGLRIFGEHASRAFHDRLDELHDVLLETLILGGRAAARTIDETGTFLTRNAALNVRYLRPFVISFDETNPLAERWAREHSAELITEISQETRKAVRVAIHQGFEQGLTPRQTALTIRNLVGLTERQTIALLRRQAMRIEAGSSAADSIRWLRRNSEQQVRKRALMIARTETIAASNEGQRQLWQQSIDKGLLAPTVERIWIVTPDDRNCSLCQAMAGERATISGLFKDGFSGPPLHPNCRCATGLVSAVSGRRAS
jgi:hypothetical protein